jgi:hypothetical protein
MNIRTLVALIVLITVSAVHAMDRDNRIVGRSIITKPRTKVVIKYGRLVSSSSIIDGIEYPVGSQEAVIARALYDQRIAEAAARASALRDTERAQREEQQFEIASRALLSLDSNVAPKNFERPEYSEFSSSSSNRENPSRQNPANN